MAEPGGPLRFCLLGPLQVWQDGRAFDLGSRQQRLVLALLLARSGRIVSMGDFVDLLWPERAPISAANMVHQHLSTLRRRLEPGLNTGERSHWVQREANGYRFEPGPGAVDLLTFRSLRQQAGERLGAGSDEPALTLLVQGLGLWSGPCAQDLQVGGHPLVLAIDEEYVSAVRTAAQVALSIGRAGLVVAAVRQAVVWNPLDEGLLADLLRVLGAEGKRAEAVGVFHRVRARLAEELGIDPGRELRAALQDVLGPRACCWRTVAGRCG